MNNLRKIDLNVEDITTFDIEKIVLISGRGEMYIPTKEELRGESFTLVRPFLILDNTSREEVKRLWYLS